MKLSWTFKDLTVHVVQETQVPVIVECQHYGDTVVVNIRDVTEDAEAITKVEGIKPMTDKASSR